MANKHNTTQFSGESSSQSRLKSVLDIRIVPGHPQGAWVECYNNSFNEEAQEGIAECHASKIQDVYDRIKVERDEKLQRFQSEVSQRVHYMEQLKKKHLKLRSIKKNQEEQNVILQRTLGLKVPYRGTVADLQALNKELLKSCIVPCETNKQLIRNEIETSNRLLSNTCSQVNTQLTRARASLLNRKLKLSSTQKDFSDTQKETRDVVPPLFNKPINDTWTGHFAIKHGGDDSVALVKDDSLLVKRNSDAERKSPCSFNSLKNSHLSPAKTDLCLSTEDLCVSENGENDEIHDGEGYTRFNQLGMGEYDICEEIGINEFHKGLIVESCDKKINENSKNINKSKSQYWNYRKIFMEIEREQVQEIRRKQEHRKRILKLKIEKEKEREKKEERISEFPETTVISTTTPERHNKTSTSSQMKSNCSKNGGNISANEEQEIYRYIEAIRQVAKERLRVSGITLPPLCPCSPEIWGSHPETCANNCVFYKNPKGFVRALTTILANNR